MKIITNTPMPLRRDWHVTTKGPYWQLTQEYRADIWGLYLTKAEAIGEGINQARNGATSLVIHGRDGRIQSVWSYDDAIVPR